MGITAAFYDPATPYFTGGGLSTLVPGLFPVAIDGHPYLIDLKSEQFRRQSIPILRNQADTANLPGEQSINPEDLWRRAAETWHHGAGQIHFDRKDSDSARFRSSKGIDVWTQWQATLLNDTAVKKSSAATNLYMVVAGARLYIGYGSTVDASLAYTTTTTSTDDFTPVTSTPAVAITGLASDGTNVWAAYGTTIEHTTTSLGVTTERVTGGTAINVVAYVKERLLVADGASIYDVTANSKGTTSTATLPAALKTHSNSAFRWVGFAEGLGAIYAAGFAGDKSIIYRTTVKADGTALDVPVVAGELPDGEIVRSIQGYLGFILVGTDRGVRFATADGNGNLTFGSLIQTSTGTSSPVRCFEPQDRFVWFGWSPYDATSTGLGRLDLSVFTSPLTPAYASDLMVTAQGAVLAIATFGGKRFLAVSGSGFYVESVNKVADGTLDSGLITYGIHDNKVPMYLEARTISLPANTSYSVAISVNGSDTFTTLGTESGDNATTTVFTTNQNQANRFELRVTLSGATTFTPTIIRVVLRSYPAAPSGEIFIVPVLLYEKIDVGNQTRTMNVLGELNFLRSVIRDHRLVAYQEATESHAVFIDDYEWQPHHQTMDNTFWNGTCILKMKSLATEST
jgi:hypothetical protein